MTKAAPNSEQTVEMLLAERQQYDAWLSALEARRDSTPSHIYDRVHADYTARLQRVVEQLNSQRAGLQKLEHSIMDRLASLDVEEARNRDEAAEAELRAAVGELSPEEHDEVVRRTAAALASVSKARDTAIPELTRIRAVLQRGAEPAAPEREPERPTPTEARPQPAGFDELTFLKSLVDAPPGARNGGSGSHPSNPAEEREPQQVKSPAPPQVVDEDHTDVKNDPPAAPARPALTGQNLDVQHEESPHLKGIQADQVKTLKCQECGTHNYPTEWYCERCGAELAAL